MGTMVEDLVRLAWQSEREGRPGTRDALLTLAVAESSVGEFVLAEQCRRVLVARRPDHWFASPVPLSQWMDSPEVVATLANLRAMFPPVRVRHMLLRGAARRGPFTGRVPSPSELLHDLVPGPTPPRPHIRPGMKSPRGALPAPEKRVRRDSSGSDRDLLAFHWSVLIAMAALLEVVTGHEAVASADVTE